MVIDVNGWSFVKGNDSYYGMTLFNSRLRLSLNSHRPLPDKAAEILANICTRVSASPSRALSMSQQGATPEGPSWTLKANVTVFRHADRTPKQKLKYNFPISEPWVQPFVRLLNGEREEVILRERDQLEAIALAVEEARSLGASGEELVKLSQLNNALFRKINLPGTKAQLKPGYKKGKTPGTRKLVKLFLVLKWGGEVSRGLKLQAQYIPSISSSPTQVSTNLAT